MTVIYLDNDFKCHINECGTMMSVETKFFDGKCRTYIEGFRFVPDGYTWIRSDGVEFHGEMIAPWKPYAELAAAQVVFEHEELERLRQELAAREASYQEGVASA